MATFLSDFVNQLDKKWHEVDLLLWEAKKHQDSNNIDLYNAICRSATVLIVAHLEGFVRDMIKAIIHDLNDNCSFGDLPSSVQRTYCRKYLGNNIDSKDKSYEKKVSVLINKFCEVECRISYDPFFFPTNKNPKPDMIRQVFQNFGIDDVFAYLHASQLDSVFSETNKKIKEDIEKQKRHVLGSIDCFPYRCKLNRINLEKCSGKTPSRTLWRDFLDEINMKRHGIAHGNSFDNSESISILEARKDKVVYLQLGLIELLTGYLMQKMGYVTSEV